MEPKFTVKKRQATSHVSCVGRTWMFTSNLSHPPISNVQSPLRSF
jgi:hypothetical protein